MKVTANNIGKRFNRNVIFKDLSYQFEKGVTYAVLGPNGSGKSTLLKVLSSMIEPDEGTIEYPEGIDENTVFKNIGFVAPYIDIPEEYTFKELLEFHSRFRKPELAIADIIAECGLGKFSEKPIKEYSSGMKQRVKLALVLFFDNLIRCYDEPCSHLDQQGFEWFDKHVRKGAKQSIVLIGSNNPLEYQSANTHLDIESFK